MTRVPTARLPDGSPVIRSILAVCGTATVVALPSAEVIDTAPPRTCATVPLTSVLPSVRLPLAAASAHRQPDARGDVLDGRRGQRAVLPLVRDDADRVADRDLRERRFGCGRRSSCPRSSSP